jgi:predicted MPP superfamily phosphohydrolase
MLISCKFQILHLFGGPMFFAPNLPKWLLIGAAWAFAVFFIFVILLLFSDILALITWLIYFIRYRKRKIMKNMLQVIHCILLIFSCACATWGMYKGMVPPVVIQQEIQISGVANQGLRIAILADLHIDSMSNIALLEKIVQQVNEQMPDIVVILGDFIDGKVSTLGKELQPLKKLKTKYGVYGIPGNHEYYSGYEEWMTFFPTLNIKMLENESIYFPEYNIALVGITDSQAKRFNLPTPDIPKALQNVSKNAVRILLAHRPTQALQACKYPIHLQLSGHTHGGIIYGFHQIVKYVNKGFVAGWHDVGNLKVYVNRGTCIWSGFPVRIGIPSEITILTVK